MDLGRLGHTFVNGCWGKRFLGFCALTSLHASHCVLLVPAAPRSTHFSVKKRGGESVGHSAVPIRVPQKSWDPCLCGNSEAVGVGHSLKHTNKHTAFFSRNLSALNKKSFHRKVSSESFLLDSRCWFLLCIFLTCQLFINYVFK